MVLDLDNQKLDELLAAGDPLVVDFYADWCGPCKMLAPIVEQVAEAYPTVTFARMNVDHYPQVAMAFGIESIPLLLLFKDGKQVDALLGFRPYDAVARAVEGLL